MLGKKVLLIEKICVDLYLYVKILLLRWKGLWKDIKSLLIFKDYIGKKCELFIWICNVKLDWIDLL